ncbi:MAG TPA: FHA domain-containing protein, partial [Oligoflexia bacterium]|nr:FHA domain-containing protein [Oligoflexia bacterium]
MAIQLTVMAIEFGFAGRPTTQIYYKDEIVLGRDSGNDVVLGRPEVSAQHAKLLVKRNGSGSDPVLCVLDLGSTNGTMVESRALEPMEEVPVRANQPIIIGNFLIKSAFVDIDLPEEESQDYSAAEPAPEGNEQQADDSFDVVLEPVQDDRWPDAQAEAAVESIEEGNAAMKLFEEEEIEETAVKRQRTYSGSIWNSKSFSQLASSSRNEQPAEIMPGDTDDSTAPAEPEEVYIEVCESEGEERAESTELTQEPDAAQEAEITFVAGGEDEVISIDFVALQLFNIAGTVKHRDSYLEGVRVAWGEREYITGRDGSFQFSDIEEGTKYALSAEKQGYIIECPEASGEIYSDLNLAFVAQKLLSLGGRVLHRGAPLAGVEIDAGDLGKTFTGADGAYCFPHIVEG